ncbi:MAG: hypothetical protein E6973_08075 [Enterobacter hormaechei]|nr:hypothetical protein [Enterobacter hormaechei]
MASDEDPVRWSCCRGLADQARPGHNTDVFPAVDELMNNIYSVTKHISQKVKEEGGDVTREGLRLVPTVDEKLYYRTEEGDCFRAYHFIEDATTYMMVENQMDFYKCGKALGKF